MLFRFASYCRNQQFIRQIIRKHFTPFCLSNQNIQSHINTLLELRKKYQDIQEPNENEQIAQEISKYEDDLDSYLKEFMIHQRQPYYLFRKNLIELAYKSCYVKRYMCLQYIQSASCGDYENHYTDEQIKQVFLAELYGIQFRINYYQNVEELAVKSLTHWQNVINNNCQFYKQWKENGYFKIEDFTKNKQFVYFEQYLECLVAVTRVFYRVGDFEKSKTYFEEAQTKILEAIQIVFYFKIQLNEMKGKEKETHLQFIEYYKNQFFKFLVNSYIVRIKISFWERNFALGEKLLNEIIQKQIANEQQRIQLSILFFESMKFSEENYIQEDYYAYISFTIKVIQNSNFIYHYYNWDMALFLDDTHGFLLLYHKDTKNNQERSEVFHQTLELISESLIEVYQNQIKHAILNHDFDIAYIWCLQAMDYLLIRQFTKHYFWDSLIFSTLVSEYSANGCKKLEQILKQIYEVLQPIIQRPLQNIIEFFEIIVELDRINDFNEINQDLLQKIEKMEFEKYFMKYQKQLALEKIYKNYNLKKELEECYENQLELLNQHKQLNWYIIEKIEEKKKNIIL